MESHMIKSINEAQKLVLQKLDVMRTSIDIIGHKMAIK
jgi:hypothetical protein